MKKPHWPIHLIIISMNKYEVQGVIDEGAYGIVLKAFLRDTDQIGNEGSTQWQLKSSRRLMRIRRCAAPSNVRSGCSRHCAANSWWISRRPFGGTCGLIEERARCTWCSSIWKKTSCN